MTEAFSTTAGDVDALVERLLHRWRTRKVWEEQNGKLVRVDDALDEEAAEALTSLCTERDDWRAAHAETVATWDESKDNWSHSLKDAEARALKAEAENKALREALEPFATGGEIRFEDWQRAAELCFGSDANRPPSESQ